MSTDVDLEPTSSAAAGAGRPSRRPPAFLVVIVVVIAAIVTLSVVLRHRDRAEEWRSGGDRLAVTAAVSITDEAGSGAVIEKLAGHPNQGAPGRQVFVVDLRVEGAPGNASTYEFVLLDRRYEPYRPLTSMGDYTSPDGSGSGWGSAWGEDLAAHYPWAARLAAVRNPDGSYSNDTLAVGIAATAESRSVLVFSLIGKPGPRVGSADDLALAMFAVGDDGAARWGRLVPVTAAS